MPLHLDAAHPRADFWGKGGRDLGTPILPFFARGHMALCAVSGQFVVPLEPPPPVRPGAQDPRATQEFLDERAKVTTRLC